MESASLYRATLKRAWHTARTHPHVWVLGFFAALLGNGGEFEFVVAQFNRLSSGAVYLGESLLTMFGTGGSTIVNVFASLLFRARENYIVLGVGVFISLAVIWIVVSAQGALIRAAARAGEGTLIEHFKAGSKSFWHIIGIILATRLLAFFVLGVVGMPLFALMVYFMDPAKALVLVSFSLGIPLLMIASLIAKYSIAYRMLEHSNWKGAVSRGLELFFGHWLISLELALTLFAINIVVGGVMILLILLFAAPFLILTNVLPQIAVAASGMFLFVGQFLAFLLLIILGSILATFQYAAWTELFLRIRKGKHMSKLLRMLGGLRAKYT